MRYSGPITKKKSIKNEGNISTFSGNPTIFVPAIEAIIPELYRVQGNVNAQNNEFFLNKVSTFDDENMLQLLNWLLWR